MNISLIQQTTTRNTVKSSPFCLLTVSKPKSFPEGFTVSTTNHPTQKNVNETTLCFADMVLCVEIQRLLHERMGVVMTCP